MMLAELTWMLRRSTRSVASSVKSTIASGPDWYRFWTDYFNYVRSARPEERVDVEALFPCLDDATRETQVEPTYFYQNSWAFDRIVEQKPAQHVDIGSHHMFVALLSRIVPVTMVDIRPLSVELRSLHFREGSILELPFEDASLTSVSSICVIEHIGLGRYGDPIDSLGTERALAELKRVVMPGGHLYLSVPLDDVRRTYFNAHRAFTENYLEQLFHPFEIVDRRYIFGHTFSQERQSGFGTGCYQLRRPQ